MRGRRRKGWRRVINGVSISAFVVVLFVALPLYWAGLRCGGSSPWW
jgi:hypothetical protein